MGFTITGGVSISGGVSLIPPAGSPSPPIQGSNFGYQSGGDPSNNGIEKYSFTSDGNSTDVGNLTNFGGGLAGHSSATDGYASCGTSRIINKFSFTSDGNASNIGSSLRKFRAGQSSINTGYGYLSGGEPGVTNVSKFSFSSNGDASDVGNLSVARTYTNGTNSTTHGYTAGGMSSTHSTFYNVIDKFPFASDTDTATDVGDLTVGRRSIATNFSEDNGYAAGGRSSGKYNVIEKWSFSTDGNATDVGDLSTSVEGPAGTSSTMSGYVTAGEGPSNNSNEIQKFPFASDSNATDVGDLITSVYFTSGQQY